MNNVGLEAFNSALSFFNQELFKTAPRDADSFMEKIHEISAGFMAASATNLKSIAINKEQYLKLCEFTWNHAPVLSMQDQS